MESSILQTNNKIIKPIVLVGMMGCGKSEIGHRLSRALSVPFIDTDAAIEEAQGISVSDIFEKHGQEYFRRLESEKISELLEQGGSVISTGGGLVTTPENLDLIKDRSISIWLQSSVATILQRVQGDDSRPLLRTDNPKETLEGLLNARKELYSKADIHINNEDSPEKVLSDIQHHLGKYYETA